MLLLADYFVKAGSYDQALNYQSVGQGSHGTKNFGELYQKAVSKQRQQKISTV